MLLADLDGCYLDTPLMHAQTNTQSHTSNQELNVSQMLSMDMEGIQFCIVHKSHVMKD